MINMKDLIKKQTDMIRRESGMNLVSEAKRLDDKHLNKLHKMTQSNNHGEARIFLSTLLGNKKMLKFYNAMKDLNDIFGGDGPEQSKLKQIHNYFRQCNLDYCSDHNYQLHYQYKQLYLQEI